MRDLPNGFIPKFWDTSINGHAYPTVTEPKDGSKTIAISDTGLMGVLQISGIDPVGDPVLVNRRVWWLFDAKDYDALVATASAYYAPCDGTPTKLAFVREAIENKNTFKEKAVSLKLGKDAEYGMDRS